MAPDTPKDSENEEEAAGSSSSSSEEPNDFSGVDQSEIDALIYALEESESSPTGGQESNSGGVDQSENDNLIGALEESESSSSEAPAEDNATPSAPVEESEPAQPTAEEAPSPESVSEEPTLLGQDELDALIAEFEIAEKLPATSSVGQQAGSEKSLAPVAPVEPETKPAESEVPLAEDDHSAAENVVDPQSDIDRIIAESAQSSDEPDSSVQDATPQELTGEPEQEATEIDLEAALEELEEAAQEEAAPDSADPERVDTASIAEGELAAIVTEVQSAMSPAAEPTAEESDATPILDRSDDDPLVERDMDERLIKETGQADDDLAPVEAPIPAVEADVVETAAFSEIESRASEEPDSPAALLERVASENVAAGAVENAEATAAPPEMVEALPEESAIAPETLDAPPKSTEVETQGPSSRPRDIFRDREAATLPPSPIELFMRSPARASASIAAGFLLFVATFAYFYFNQLVSVSDLASFPTSDPNALGRVVLHARELLDEDDSSEALKLLDDALERAPANAAGVGDAKFLRLEALYQRLPNSVPRDAANAMHAEIDSIVDSERAHPRAPEALYWKAKIYEREGNPIAARAEYRGILDNFGNAENLDEVLLALSQLLLDSGRPLQAVTYLQRVIQDYPRTASAASARLSLGDAYAAAGDFDGARVVYIRLADSQANTSNGALAYERIGQLDVDSGKYDRAIRELRTRLETATSVEGNDRVYLLLAKAYRGKGELRNARDTLVELLEFFPESDTTASALVELSRVMVFMGLEREAVRMATQAAQRFPDNIEVLSNAGTLLGEYGDVLAAGRALFAAHSAGANEPELLLAAGRHFRLAGANDDAVSTFQELLTLFPTSSQALEGNIEWARVLYAEGEITEAIERLEGLTLATEGQPRRLPVLKAMAEMYADLGLGHEVARIHAQIAGIAQEPALLAQAAVALIREGDVDAGMRVADRVDISKLLDEDAYALMMAKGEVGLRRESGEALAMMEKAHADYPEHRTPEGVQKLLEANLTTGATARARALVTELQERVMQSEKAEEAAWLERAAITWGDYLYEHNDYRAALDAYAIALDPAQPEILTDAAQAFEGVLTEARLWSMYQRANALFSLARFQESLDSYSTVAASSSVWADDAKAKVESVRIEIRLRGDPVSETRNTG